MAASNRQESKNILVTGGAGYVGSHTCKALADSGYNPIAYDSLERGRHEAVRWGPLEKGDILDRRRLKEVFERYRPSAVMHFAAYAYVGESVLDPGKYYRNNVAGGLTLLEAMRDSGLDLMIFSSSCSIYGHPEKLPISEDHPRKPISPYGATKLMFESILSDFEAAHGIRAISLRYFNAAGADPGIGLGEDHDPETHLIPLAVDAAMGRRPCLEIYGTDYPTPDGTAVRDYLHVTDIAQAHLLALDYLREGGSKRAFNLGTGRGHSVLEVIRSLERITGKKVPTMDRPRRPGDPAVLVADAGRAVNDLNWRPEYSELETILETAWRWHGRDIKRR